MTGHGTLEMLMFVPDHLLAGVQDQILKVFGGTIRRANGTIAGFLMEGWELIQRVERGFPLNIEGIEAALGSVQAAVQLTNVIGILNLGVSAVGFAVMTRRLNIIVGQLDRIQIQMEQTAHGIGWLKNHALDNLRASASTALAEMARAERQDDRALLQSARSKADNTRRSITMMLERMLADRTAITEYAIFDELFKAAAVLTMLETRADDTLEGPAQAAIDLQTTVADFRRVGKSLHATITNFGASPAALLEVGIQGRPALKAARDNVRVVTEILEGYVDQLRLRDILGLDREGWRSLTAPEGSGAFTCLAVPQGSTEDLLQLAQTHPEVLRGR